MYELATRKALTLEQRIRHEERNGEPTYAVSKYSGVPATNEELAAILTEMVAVYPIINEKLAVLVKVLKANNFTAGRLKDACMHVMETCKYKEPTIADFVQFDKCVKLYTYSEACRLVTSGQARFDNDGGDLKLYCKRPVCLWYRESERAKVMGGL